MQIRIHAVAIVIALAAPAILRAQPKAVTVSSPTRLDWKFASKGFGPKQSQLPAEFDSRKQRYRLYVPKIVDGKKTHPLIVFISPSNNPAGWPNFQKICEREGAFFCSPYGAGNGTQAGKRARIILDMIDDVRRKYRIDADQTYLGGFSGGGRMACTIAFSLPEYFGGVIPVCGTNPLPNLSYLRHRIHDRLSVAFVTGEKDFNRKENEVYMYPYLKELNIRTNLWVVPKMGHSIPSANVMAKVVDWLSQDLKRRRADAAAYPDLAVSATVTPTPTEQAARLLKTASAELKNPTRIWRGVTLLQGVIARWGNSQSGQKARGEIKRIVSDQNLLKHVAVQGAKDEQLFLTAQAKAFERFGQREPAIRAWDLLAQLHPDTPAGRYAAEQAKRLRKP